MVDVLKVPTLAITGMAVKGARFSSLEEFGSSIYYGSNPSQSAGQDPLSCQDLQSFLNNLLQGTGSAKTKMVMIVFQPHLEEKVHRLETSLTIKALSDQDQSLANAFAAAAIILTNKTFDSVLILDEKQPSGILFAVWLSTESAARMSGMPIIATISGAAINPKPDNGISLVDHLIGEVLKVNQTHPGQVGLLLTTSPLQVAPVLRTPKKLTRVIQADHGRTCALSAGFGGLGTIIKAVWCLDQRLIPGTKDWKSPANLSDWQKSTFYVPTESRGWFTNADTAPRTALVVSDSAEDAESVFLLQEGRRKNIVQFSVRSHAPLMVFPIGANSLQNLIANLLHFMDQFSTEPDLKRLSSQKLMRYHNKQRPDNFVACMLGDTGNDIVSEIQFALKGIPFAFDRQADWRTPKGSYCSPNPLMDTGSVSFVYPGGFNTYSGVAREFFHLFPTVHDRMEKVSLNTSDLMKDKMLYPRQMRALTLSELAEAERKLASEPLAMLVSGISLSTMFTFLLRDVFEVSPSSSFGYSLGEISMMFANGIWTQVDEASAALHNSPLFRSRLAGSQNAIREKWEFAMALQNEQSRPIWENHILMSTPAAVNEAISKEGRVFMTHINTPNQVVIGGDPIGCKRVIHRLACNSLQAPFDYALHCEAMQSEYDEFKRLLSWSVADMPEMTFLSAARYQAMPLNKSAIAENIAYGLTHRLDFPRLINKAYSNDARIFIELGAGGNCSRWITETLKDKPHAAFPTNLKGLSDHAAVCQLLAKLISHRVPVSLSTFLN